MENKKIVVGFELVLMVVLVFAFAFMVADVVPVSSAQDGDGCCETLVDGTMYASVSSADCADGAQFVEGVRCDDTAFGRRGCCFSEENGDYYENTAIAECGYWNWTDDKFCNMPEARGGCCALGSINLYGTRRKCEIYTENMALGDNVVVDWDAGIGETECIAGALSQVEGACVFGGGSCSFGTKVECNSYGGEFNEGLLCTAPVLNTSCVGTSETSCVEGRDEIYFLDSCGNRANVYDSSRVKDSSYWDRVVSDGLCGEGGSAGSESCGNCNRFAGGICGSVDGSGFKVDSGNYYCKDTSCLVNGTRYDNGESWCVYDGKIGEGDDVVGSRHWRYVCNYGVAVVEPCADYRNEVCVQDNTLDASGNVDFMNSRCVKNDWRKCLAINEELAGGDIEELTEECLGTFGCSIRGVQVDKFGFNMCVPDYPAGFDLWTEDKGEIEEKEKLCEIGSQFCVMYYVKDSRGKWDCKENCHCEDPTFTEQMNDFCVGLGDCGGYVNYVGGYDDGYSVSIAPGLSDGKIAEYVKNIFPVKGLFASTNLSDIGEEELSDVSHYARVIERNIYGLKSKWYTGTLQFLLGIGSSKKEVVEFDCLPWRPPKGDAECGSCNGDSLKPCSEYRCESLGSGCEFINKGTENELCEALADDGGFPILGPQLGTISSDVNYTSVSEDGFEISSLDGGCVAAYTKLVFGVETDEPAQCKFDLELNDFDEMGFVLGSNSYTRNHSIRYVLPDPSGGESRGLNWTGDLTMYVKCQDRFGHESPGFYKVDVCVKEGPDITAPLVDAFGPGDGTMVGYNVSSKYVEMYVNEDDVSCRWDVEDKDYIVMANDWVCDDNPSGVFGSLSKCNATLPVGVGDSEFFIRCKDQGWLSSGCGGVGVSGCGEGRNANSESFVYTLRKPEKKIVIDWIEPYDDFEISTASATIDFKIATSGGGDLHYCSYSFDGYDNLVANLFQTGAERPHAWAMNWPAGNHDIYVECKDETGDSDRAMTSFKIVRDSSTPQVSRVWQSGGSLHLITNEDAECRYMTSNCKYSWADGLLAGDGEEHTISAVRGDTYYIKCKDEFGNVPSGCSIEVRAL